MSEPDRQLSRLIEWTGERCVPWVDDWQVLYEHLHRYYFAADLAEGKTVLDLGSGEGYGSDILAGRAKTVLGIELDPQAVAHASTNYMRENLEFRRGSILDQDDLPDDSFELVVCYEVIEHITEHDALLALVRRVLVPGGVFIVSTPDREVYSEATDFHNPYHTKELSRVEFDELLAGNFAHHRLWSQTVTLGSTLRRLDAPAEPGVADEIFVGREGESWQRRARPPVPYLVAVASESALPEVPAFSLLNDSRGDAMSAPRAPSAFEAPETGAWAAGTDRLTELWEPERLRRQVEIFESALASQLRVNQESQAEISRLRQALEPSQGEVASLSGELGEIKSSRAWRFLSRYRSLRENLTGQAPRSQA